MAPQGDPFDGCHGTKFYHGCAELNFAVLTVDGLFVV